MKANELRIGNLVEYFVKDELDQRKEWWEVNILDIDDIADIDSCGCESAGYRPILLTEEWLMRLGFTSENTYSNFTLNEIEIASSFRVIKTNERKSFYLDGEIPDFMKIKIQHVHQLQNLFFCLCGEELEIKR